MFYYHWALFSFILFLIYVLLEVLILLIFCKYQSKTVVYCTLVGGGDILYHRNSHERSSRLQPYLWELVCRPHQTCWKGKYSEIASSATCEVFSNVSTFLEYFMISHPYRPALALHFFSPSPKICMLGVVSIHLSSMCFLRRQKQDQRYSFSKGKEDKENERPCSYCFRVLVKNPTSKIKKNEVVH